MAIPTRIIPGTFMPKRQTSFMQRASVELPEQMEETPKDISDLAMVIYGATGIGKSSFVRHFGKALALRFEPSSKFIRRLQTPILYKWSMAIQYIQSAEKNLKGYTTMVIDTAGPAYDRCIEAVSERLHISHPGKAKDYGASWKEVHNEFHQFHSRIASLNVGFIAVAHDSIEDSENNPMAVRQITPHFSGWLMDFYKRWVDVIGFYFFDAFKRYLLIRGNEYFMAKCNTEDRFLTPNGQRVVCIPMGDSSEEAHDNFMKAFNNEQIDTYEDIIQKRIRKPEKLKPVSNEKKTLVVKPKAIIKNASPALAVKRG